MPDDTRQLLEHLATCDDCTNLLNEYRRLREQFRHLPPPPPPSDEIRQRVWEQTVERGEPSRFYRWFGVSGARVGVSAVGALAVLLIATAFILVRGYERGMAPAVAGSPPTFVHEWPVQKPIEITFNKRMDQASVYDHLRIYPPSEKGRLPISWRDNTLVIGASPSESVPLLANTDYRITILPGAKDAYGGSMKSGWEMRLRTTTALAQEPDPTERPTDTPQPTPTQAAQAVVPSPTATDAPTNPPTQPPPTATSAPPTQAPPTQAPPTEPSEQTPAPGNGGAHPTGTPRPATPTPTAVAPSPTPTTRPDPTATPSPEPATPDPGTPPADATPPPGTPPGTPPAAATPVPVTGAFGSVYWANEDVQQRLGLPAARGAYATSAAVLDFQRGTMYARFDTYIIYVLRGDGTWASVVNTWTAEDGYYGGPAPVPNLWIPSKAFGKVWTENPVVQEQLGYATTETAHEPMDGRIQEFANGLMLYSDQGFVYVLYFDTASAGQWEVYPDSSGRGDLLTPTPEPTPSDPPATPEPTAPSEPTEEPTATPLATPEPTPAGTPEATPAPSESPTPGETPTPSETPTPDATPSPEVTPSP